MIQDRGVSHRGLADAVGVSKQSVTNWTQGRHEPGLAQVRRLAAVLVVPVAYLVGEDAVAPSRLRSEAEEVVMRLAELELRRTAKTLSDSAPDLLALLADAEALARRGRSR